MFGALLGRLIAVSHKVKRAPCANEKEVNYLSAITKKPLTCDLAVVQASLGFGNECYLIRVFV